MKQKMLGCYNYFKIIIQIYVFQYIECSKCGCLFKSYNRRFKTCRLCLLDIIDKEIK